ncbi:MAG: cell division protein FtsZ [Candidatus Methanomarinus sp.]|nr:MAG: cell division protein FtsZ [ANME-2 cluster archaeon]
MNMDFFHENKKVIRLIGCGGGGCKVTNDIAREHINGIECYAINTDAQDLINSKVDKKILIGFSKTHGLGAGGLIETGEQAAIEDEPKIESAVTGSDVVFIICALGGGNSGAAPIVAKAAKKAGALTIAMVTLPFNSAGPFNKTNAETIFYRLLDETDTTIAVPLDIFKEAALDEPIETLFTLVAKNIFIHVIRDTQKLVNKTGSSIRDFGYNRALIKEMIDKSIVKGCSC